MSNFDDNPFGEPAVDNPFAVSIITWTHINMCACVRVSVCTVHTIQLNEKYCVYIFIFHHFYSCGVYNMRARIFTLYFYTSCLKQNRPFFWLITYGLCYCCCRFCRYHFYFYSNKKNTTLLSQSFRLFIRLIIRSISFLSLSLFLNRDDIDAQNRIQLFNKLLPVMHQNRTF